MEMRLAGDGGTERGTRREKRTRVVKDCAADCVDSTLYLIRTILEHQSCEISR